MTEKNRNSEINNIDWKAFSISLIAAPAVLVSAMLIPLYVGDALNGSRNLREWIAGVRAFSAIGVVLYLFIGTPVLIVHLRQHAAHIGRIVLLSIVSQLWVLALGCLIALVTFDLAFVMFAAISVVFGLVGAPPLAALFALFYIRFAR